MAFASPQLDRRVIDRVVVGATRRVVAQLLPPSLPPSLSRSLRPSFFRAATALGRHALWRHLALPGLVQCKPGLVHWAYSGQAQAAVLRGYFLSNSELRELQTTGANTHGDATKKCNISRTSLPINLYF